MASGSSSQLTPGCPLEILLNLASLPALVVRQQVWLCRRQENQEERKDEMDHLPSLPTCSFMNLNLWFILCDKWAYFDIKIFSAPRYPKAYLFLQLYCQGVKGFPDWKTQDYLREALSPRADTWLSGDDICGDAHV